MASKKVLSGEVVVDLLEKMLESQQAMQRDIGRMRESQQTMTHDISGMRGEVGGMRDEIGGMRGEIGGMRAEIGGMRAEMGAMRGEMRSGFSDVTERLERLEVATVGVGRVTALEDRVRRLEARIGTDPER